MPERGRSDSIRVTVRVPRGLLEEVEAAVEAGEFHNRSEAIRSALRLRFSPTIDREVVFSGGRKRVTAVGDTARTDGGHETCSVLGCDESVTHVRGGDIPSTVCAGHAGPNATTVDQ